MNNAQNLREIVFVMEKLSYYIGLKPQEFWSLTYREANNYIEYNLMRLLEDYKRDIILQEAVSNKLIQADCMNKKPKVVPLKSMFKELFKEEK